LVSNYLGFHPQTQKLETPKHYHRKEQLSNFHLNGHILGFHPQTQKVRTTL